MTSQQCGSWCCRDDSRCQLACQLRTASCPESSILIQRRHSRRAAHPEAMRSEAGVYAIRRRVSSPRSIDLSCRSLTFFHLSSRVNTGLRPFGVSLLYAGYDPHYRFQLYHSDPSGNYSGWKATCIGANNGTAQSLLKQEYKDDIDVKTAISLVLKTMSKTMDSTTLGSEKRKFP